MQNTRANLFPHLAVVLVLCIVHLLLRLPTAYIKMPLYDDGETLYHTLSILNGQIPYLDDYNHHFAGYLLPYIATAKIFGFSISLLQQVYFITQVFGSFAVYLILRLFFPLPLALVGALLALSAREPWVLGYFIQYEINFIYAWMLYFYLYYLRKGGALKLQLANFLCGICAIFDQRAAVFLFLPFLCAYLGCRKKVRLIFIEIPVSILFTIIPIAYCWYYLHLHQAWQNFVEQTWIFPKEYRVGSLNLAQLFWENLRLHKFLVEHNPVSLVMGMIGFAQLLRAVRFESEQRLKSAYFFIIAFAFPLALMPWLGGRNYHYYTLTWLPYLAILSVFAFDFFKRVGRIAWLISVFFAFAPVLLTLVKAIGTIELKPKDKYSDGAVETANFLKENLKPTDKIYVWGYRPDIYVYLNVLSPYPFVNQIMIHPDRAILDKEERIKHIYPKYDSIFKDALNASLPTYFVIFERKDYSGLYSNADDLVRKTISTNYKEAFKITKKDYLGEDCTFIVYQHKPANAKAK